ncbi:MAG: fumarylacetoacetate hydrolase family protein [Acidimicrobiales bacterium]
MAGGERSTGTVKLASLRGGGRDGTLVVVDRDLERAVEVPDIAPTLLHALEQWPRAAPELAAVYEQLCGGAKRGSFPLAVEELASPLPRCHQFLDGSVYLHHMEQARKARGAAMPPNYKTEPLLYQGPSNAFDGPTQPMVLADEALQLDYEPEIAVVLDDVPMGTLVQDASQHVKLVMLLNDYTLRALTLTELPKGFGFMQAKPTSSFSPVALSVDELGALWDAERFHLEVTSAVNGKQMGRADAAVGMFFTYPQLIAYAARTRVLSAGTILGAGAISNPDPATGYGCIAEARVTEQMESGEAKTPFLRFGDTVRIDALDRTGGELFGALEQTIVPPGV